MDKLICAGCGAEIQTEDESAAGYAPKSALERETVICKRCFRLKHYNEVQDVDYDDDDFLEMLQQINDTDSLVVQLIDIFDFNGSLIPGLNRLTGNNPVILAANKMDLLPKSVNLNKVEKWLRREAKEAGLLVEDVHLISASTNQGIDELAEAIEQNRSRKDVFVVGTTNVGKSTLINELINRSTGIKDAITTSYFPGTTLGFIDIPLDDHSSLYDTPGVIQRHQLAHYVSDEDLKLITPQKEIKAKIYQLNEEQTLFFGGLARMDFVKGEHSSFVCYLSNRIPIHRTKMEKAGHITENRIGEMLVPPDENSLSKLPQWKRQTFRVPEGKHDVVISGLGWIMIPEGEVTVHIHAPEGVKISLRESLI
ncbi:ribosome biogenesis GTPase YqeH [Salimicrobium humidisoli]|uniref:Ribosome biogenesis GTPase YqeH n=1 Tax=Salimicrobium humidisoli TaxID=2029857 RepID=A0ABX4HVF8_9BACI|nr:ribosome biogenesis GTPase YqeH [Salimicrobium humidisoli]PBB06827.1 ribosome biogenesis GTPase YqeH [Salimicrobium humidisoli]